MYNLLFLKADNLSYTRRFIFVVGALFVLIALLRFILLEMMIVIPFGLALAFGGFRYYKTAATLLLVSLALIAWVNHQHQPALYHSLRNSIR